MKTLRAMLILTGIWAPLCASASVCGGLNPVLVTTTPVSFGSYSANSASADTANGTINVYCTVQTSNTLPSFTVALSAGGSGSFSTRHMAYLTSTLNYNLYTSASYATVWGDGTGATAVQSYNTGTGVASTSYTVFGNVPTQQYVAAGLYSDLITVTITY